MRRIQIRPVPAERHDPPPPSAKTEREHRPEAPHEPETAEYHPVGQPPIPHPRLLRGQTLQTDTDEGQTLLGEGVAGGGRAERAPGVLGGARHDLRADGVHVDVVHHRAEVFAARDEHALESPLPQRPLAKGQTPDFSLLGYSLLRAWC